MHSALSPPLIGDGVIIGALNVYAHAKHYFDDRAAQLGEAFAIPAAISVLNAQALHQAQRLIAQLEHALTGRAVIERAVGILLSRSGCTPDDAFEKLRTISRNDRTKLVTVAQNLITEATFRARARHHGNHPQV